MPLDTQSKIDLINTDPKLATSIMTGPLPQDDFVGGISLGADYSKYLQMRRDPHVRSVLQRRRQSILARRVVVEYPKKSKGNTKTIEAFKHALTAIHYEGLCSTLLNSGQLVGFSVVRLDWQKNEENIVVPAWQFVPQDRFVFAWHEPDNKGVPCCDGSNLDPKTEIVLVQGYELRLLTKANPMKGERCPKNRFLIYTFDADESPWGLGLGYSIYPWYVVKRESMKAWLLHSDRLGSPPVLGNTPETVDENDPEFVALLRKFENFLKAVSPNAWARLPAGFEAEVMDLVGNVGPEVHENLIRTANDEISKVVLGEVPYSDKATGSYAANISQVEDREASLIDSDVNILDDPCQDQLWSVFGALNHPDQPVPTVRRETRADDREQEAQKLEQERKKNRIDQDKTMQELGYRVKPDRVSEVYGDEYVDASSIQQSEDVDKPQALAAVLGPRTDTLLTFLQSIGQSGYPRDNAIAVVSNVFGIPKAIAEALVPEPQEQPAEGTAPGQSPPTDLAGMLGEIGLGEDQPPEAPEEAAVEPQFVEIDAEYLNFVVSDWFGLIEFASGAKPAKEKKCTPGKSHFCRTQGGAGTCLPLSKKCRFKPDGDLKDLSNYVADTIGGEAATASTSTGGKKTEFHQQWEGAFNNAPDDFKAVLERIDQPDRLDAPEGSASHFKSGTQSIHMRPSYKPGDEYSDAVYRHEYGHHLDYELGTGKRKPPPWDAIAVELGEPSVESLLKRAKQGKAADVRNALIKRAWDREDELGAQFASTSKKGRTAFDADEKSLLDRQTQADAKLKAVADKLPPADREVLAKAKGIDISTPQGKVEMGRLQAARLVDKSVKEKAAAAGVKFKDGNELYQKYGDSYFKGDDIYAETFNELKKSHPEKLSSLVPRLIAAQRTGDIQSLTSLVNTALKTNNVNDLIGSVTQNRVGQGHDSAYYKKKIEAKYTESFANVSDLYSRNHKLSNKFMAEMMPNGLKFYQDTIRGKS